MCQQVHNQNENPKLLSSEHATDENLLYRVDTMQQKFNQILNTLKEKISHSQNNHQTLKQDLPSFKILQAFLNDQSMAQNLFQKILSKVQYNQGDQTLSIRKEFITVESETKDPTSLNIEALSNLVDRIDQQINLFHNDQRSPFSQSKSPFSQSKSPFLSSRSPFNGRNQSNDFGRSGFVLDKVREDTSIAASPTNYFKQSQNFFSGTSKSIEFAPSKTLSNVYSNPREKIQFQFDKQSIMSRQIQSISKYSFSPEYIAQGLQIDGNNVRLLKDLDKRMVLIQPVLYGGGGVTKESSIKLRVKTLKNLNQRYPMAVGICVLSKIQKSNFIFSGNSEHLKTSREKFQDHGCYLVNSNGVIRSCIQSDDLTNSESKMRFFSGSDIQIVFKPFHSQVVIKRFNDKDKSQEIITTLNIKIEEGAKIYGCIRLADLQDQFEIIP